MIALPRLPHENFQCFWATGTGWGTYSLKRTQSGTVQFTIKTLEDRGAADALKLFAVLLRETSAECLRPVGNA